MVHLHPCKQHARTHTHTHTHTHHMCWASGITHLIAALLHQPPQLGLLPGVFLTQHVVSLRARVCVCVCARATGTTEVTRNQPLRCHYITSSSTEDGLEGTQIAFLHLRRALISSCVHSMCVLSKMKTCCLTHRQRYRCLQLPEQPLQSAPCAISHRVQPAHARPANKPDKFGGAGE
jgi:hypothetical protein